MNNISKIIYNHNKNLVEKLLRHISEQINYFGIVEIKKIVVLVEYVIPRK